MISQKLYQLEKEIAAFLLDKLEHEEITLEKAAVIARYVLKALPDNLSDEQIDRIIPTLDDTFVELAAVVHKHVREHEAVMADAIASQAEVMIKKGKLDEALQLMNDHIAKKI